MKLAKIEYLKGMREKSRKEWRQRFNNLVANLKGNAKLEVIVKGREAYLSPIKKDISVEIDSKYVFPCIKYAGPKFAIVHNGCGDVKVYYSPLDCCRS